MIQKKIAEAQVPNYAPIPYGGIKIFLYTIFVGFVLFMAFVMFGQLHPAVSIGWKLCSSISVVVVSLFLFGPSLNFLKEYYQRNIRGYILIIIRNQGLTDENFYLITEISRAFKKIDIAKDYYIVLRLGGWFGQWRSGSYCRTFFCSDDGRIGDPFVSFGLVHLFFRYVDKVKSSINAPEDWLIEIRDYEGNRIICDWRKAFVLLREIRFSPKEFESGQSHHILFNVLTNFISRSIWLTSAESAKKRLTDNAASQQKDFLELLFDCTDGINESKRFIQSKEAQRLRLSLVKKWLPRITSWLPDWDPRRQELEKIFKCSGETSRLQSETKPAEKDDPAEAEECCSGCTLCGTSCLPAIPTPAPTESNATTPFCATFRYCQYCGECIPAALDSCPVCSGK
ncbi:MAG: hypothetical protein WC473_04315 [Patescibacteria group bacterium]